MSFFRALAVSTFCLSLAVYAQEATVNHGVNLRSDPSTANPPIGHLSSGSTVTLLSETPKAGFYHVKTPDGTEGWIGKKYLTLGEPSTSATTSPSAPTASGCDSSLWNHVYKKTRLVVIEPCTAVSGRLHIVRHELDGDVHMQLTLDPQFSGLLNARNSKQNNALVIETMCDRPPTQADAISACAGFSQKFAALTEGAHVKVTGSYVEDRDPGHGWREIHPITAVEVLP
jgi:uncharacterized protein YgiM (DUF1202 family)